MSNYRNEQREVRKEAVSRENVNLRHQLLSSCRVSHEPSIRGHHYTAVYTVPCSLLLLSASCCPFGVDWYFPPSHSLLPVAKLRMEVLHTLREVTLFRRLCFLSLVRCCCLRPTVLIVRKAGLGSLVIETMTAIDNFEFFANFMDNAVADVEETEDGGQGREESKRQFSEYSERDSESAVDGVRAGRK